MKNRSLGTSLKTLAFSAAFVVTASSCLLAQTIAKAPVPFADQKIAATVCNARMLNGRYGYSFAGTFYVAPSVPVQLVSVGVMSFDGDGSISGVDTNSFGGDITTYATSGSYSVDSDCTGTLSVALPSGFIIENRIVIVAEGKEILLIQTNPGTVIYGSLKR